MDFASPLTRGRLVKRYKRFLADVVLDGGEAVTAHVANPGAMTGLAEPGMEVWLSRSASPTRKLPWSWELVRVGEHLVGINTAHPNRLVEEALAATAIPELAAYGTVRREVRYGQRSRVDFLLTQGGLPDCYLEIKNVHLRRGTAAEFPDSVTARGTKHLAELSAMVAEGHRAVMLYVVQRGDCDRFAIAADIDPAYAAALDRARSAGVETLCYGCKITRGGILLESPMIIAI